MMHRKLSMAWEQWQWYYAQMMAALAARAKGQASQMQTECPICGAGMDGYRIDDGCHYVNGLCGYYNALEG